MQWSRYNYLFSNQKDEYFIFNALTNAFASIDKGTFESLIEIKHDINHLKKIDYSVKKQLIDSKIIVESDEVEFLKLKFLKQNSRFNKDWLGLTIAPTLYCNFNCSYCYEESRPPVYMSDEVENGIIHFIQKQEMKYGVVITWYGGEPLLNFKRIISISNKLKELNINFYANIISNGYLLNKEVASKFDMLNIKSIQITLDGTESIHNKRRPLLNGKGSFETIIKNIENLINVTNDDFRINIRVNIDKENQGNYNELIYFLYTHFKSNKINVYSAFVNAYSESCVSTHSCFFDRTQKVKFNIEQYKKYGIAHERTFFKEVNYLECMARNINSFLVDPRGNLYKCWQDINNSEKVIGNVLNETINENLSLKYLSGADPLEDESCKNCFHLPICGGGCPYYRLENKFNNCKFDLCYEAKGNLKNYLEIHAELKQQP